MCCRSSQRVAWQRSPRRRCARSSVDEPRLVALTAEGLTDHGDDDLGADLVLAAFGDDDIRPAFRGFDELEMHGANGAVVLIAYGLEGSPALLDVAADSSEGADVRVRVDVDLDVELFAQRRLDEH